MKRRSLQLKKAAQHVSHELKMMSRAAELLPVHGLVNRDEDTTRPVFDAFLIHCRNALDFFYPPASALPEDMRAEDLFTDPAAWTSVRPALPSDVRAARTAINQLVAHLTYRRRSYSLPGWKWRVSLLHNHLIRCALRLAKKLPPARRAWVKVPRGPIAVEYNVL